MNTTLKKLHKQLVRTHAQLAGRLGKTKDQSEAEALLGEMEEVNFRVMMAGRLLFKETTAQIDGQVEAILSGAEELETSIRELSEMKALVAEVGAFLATVDTVLDKVKLLA